MHDRMTKCMHECILGGVWEALDDISTPLDLDLCQPVSVFSMCPITKVQEVTEN